MHYELPPTILELWPHDSLLLLLISKHDGDIVRFQDDDGDTIITV